MQQSRASLLLTETESLHWVFAPLSTFCRDTVPVPRSYPFINGMLNQGQKYMVQAEQMQGIVDI